MKSSIFIWAVVAFLVLCLGFVFLTRPAGNTTAAPVPPVAADDHVKGAASSSVVLVEYLDFECPSCGAYYPIVKRLEAEYGDRVTFVTRHFPLPGHRNGLPAARAAEAAARQGKFWEMHNLLFARQDAWGGKAAATPEVFEGYATELGLDLAQFRADVASAEVEARIERDIREGRQIGVSGTPTFFLNGTMIRPASYDAFTALIDAALGS